MKRPNKITRVQLNISDEDEFIMLGIVSTDPDYKLSLTLNKKLGLSLKAISPVMFTDESGAELIFSRFSDSAGAPDVIINLVSNRSGKKFLLRKLKNIDFILQLYDPGKSCNLENLILLLREIESVTGVFHLDLKSLKDKNLKYLSH